MKRFYLGCLITFILLRWNIPYSVYIIVFNIISFIITSLYIIHNANIEEFRKRNHYKGIKLYRQGDMIYSGWQKFTFVPGIMGLGIVIGIYDIVNFLKNPIPKNMTEKEYNNKVISDNRDKKLKDLGIQFVKKRKFKMVYLKEEMLQSIYDENNIQAAATKDLEIFLTNYNLRVRRRESLRKIINNI